MSLLQIENMSYSYDNGKTFALKDINLEFSEGKAYGIYGKSGAGKSTFLSLVAGLEPPTSGVILYGNRDIATMDRNKYRSSSVGVVFQTFNLLTHMTALENVLLSIHVSGIKMTDKKNHALGMLEKVGLDEVKANRRVLHLSGGEQQRVGIARALSFDPSVILADEPTGNLDKGTEEDILDILTSLARDDGKCVILVSHSQKLTEVVDRLYRMEHGMIV
ncbi:MAG: ABC transporter ATP-binding protein [Clostridia bacterium]